MRINQQERHVLIKVLSQYLKSNAQLRLFGSRVDDNAKGGDIDLMLIVADQKIRADIAFNKAEILSEIKLEIGDQKIDLLLCTPDSLQKDTFQKGAYDQSIPLCNW